MRKYCRLSLCPLLLVASLTLAACSVRSISDSGYYGSMSGLYGGELNEFDVLGIQTPDGTSVQDSAEMRRLLDAWSAPVLPKGSAVLLVQSGAMLPDGDMIKAFERYYKVSVLSGMVERGWEKSYSPGLRLAAARGGCRSIVVYWGVLEAKREGEGTKVISWLPIIGGIVPDETQEMCIRLKVALIDTETGHWAMLTPEPLEDRALSADYTRETQDQNQVRLLKAKAYSAAVEEIVAKYAGGAEPAVPGRMR